MRRTVWGWMLPAILCVMCNATGYGWGLLPHIGNGNVLLFELLGKQTPVQQVCVQSYVDQNTMMDGLPLGESTTPEELVAWEQNALNQWMSSVRKLIQDSSRSGEFADFLAVWPQRVTLQYVKNCHEKALRIVYWPRRFRGAYSVVEHNGKKVLKHNTGVFTDDPAERGSQFTKANVVCERNGCSLRLFESLTALRNEKDVFVHETGHLLGLDDQYKTEFGDEPSMHSAFSFLSVISPQMRYSVASVMNNLAEYRKQIWPDDVDGIINAVDFVEFYDRGHLSDRVRNGWKSFSLAHKGVYYAYAMPFIAGQEKPVRIPQGLLNKVQAYQQQMAGIDITEIRQMEAFKAQAEAYLKAIETKQAELKKLGKAPQSNLQSLTAMTADNLTYLLARGRARYYEECAGMLEGVLREFESLDAKVSRGLRAGDESAETLTRQIGDRRYYAYDKQQMQQILKQQAAFKQKYPQFPKLEPLDEKQLRLTETGYFVYPHGENHHCAGGGEEVDVWTPLVQHKYVDKNNRHVVRYFYLCKNHKRPDLGSENYKKYTFRTAQEAQNVNQPTAVTYGMAADELKARNVRAEVASGLNFGKTKHVFRG